MNEENKIENKKITKADLVEAIYQTPGVTADKKVIKETVDIFLDELKSSLEKGAIIELRGFGTFEPRLRKGRKDARNPKTGASISVAPHYVAAFRAGQELKNKLWDLDKSTK